MLMLGEFYKLTNPQKSIWKNRIKNRMAEIVEEQKSVPSKKIRADLKNFIL